MTEYLPRAKILRDPYGLTATWLGVGLVSKAPGTIGSLAAMPFAALIHYFTGDLTLFIASVALFFVGIYVSNNYMREFERTGDPKEVVIDEVAGQWLTLSFLGFGVYQYALGFILFRLFDITKLWPVSWADRNLKTGLGVMVDDIFAAIYAVLTFLLLEYLRTFV